jgi:hypothetical protein
MHTSREKAQLAISQVSTAVRSFAIASRARPTCALMVAKSGRPDFAWGEGCGEGLRTPGRAQSLYCAVQPCPAHRTHWRRPWRNRVIAPHKDSPAAPTTPSILTSATTSTSSAPPPRPVRHQHHPRDLVRLGGAGPANWRGCAARGNAPPETLAALDRSLGHLLGDLAPATSPIG